jgi:hypothetical protein
MFHILPDGGAQPVDAACVARAVAALRPAGHRLARKSRSISRAAGFLRDALDRDELTQAPADWRQSFSGPFPSSPSRNMPAPLRALSAGRWVRSAMNDRPEE